MKCKQRNDCCSFNFPAIPTKWLLFFEFAFTLGTAVVYLADIVTDTLTLKMYYERGWLVAFGLSIFFIVAPSILLAVLEYKFLKKAYGKQVSWKTIGLRTALNVPFQLTVIWYHCVLTYSYFKSWLNLRPMRGVETKRNTLSTAKWYDPTTLERSRGASLSSLNELDSYQPSNGENRLTSRENISRSLRDLDIDGEETADGKTSWWKRLTKEQWLGHLNKLKLSESMLESLPQLLINLFLIIRYPNTAVIQYISAVLSYLSLCGGVVRYDKTRKDNEANRWMVDRTLLHSRAFYTRLEWPQILFISTYKACFLAARSLAFVYFAIYMTWIILIPILIHWACLLVYLVYRWYPDFKKVTRQLRQADYKYRAYIFLSQDFMSVFIESLIGIFIYVRPYYHAFLDQPYCFMFFYYVAYVTENVVLFLVPGIVKSMSHSDDHLELYRYYPLLATELFLNVLGSVLCATYYLAVHKSRAYTTHAYPMASRFLCCLCLANQSEDRADDDVTWLPIRDEWTVCKQVETRELFFLTKEQLKSFRSTYNTVVRNDRHRSRTIECFIDDRCRIFYAPRSKMKRFVKVPCNVATLRSSHGPLSGRNEMTSSVAIDGLEEFVPSDNDRTDLVDPHVYRLPEESSEPSTSPVEERPVRKPRVKSLRSHGRDLAGGDCYLEQDRSEPEVPSHPVPLPRKGLTPTDPRMEPVASSSLPSSSSSRISSTSELPLRSSPPSLPDDVKVTSSNRHQDFDDSTYRINKSKDTSKSSVKKEKFYSTNQKEPDDHVTEHSAAAAANQDWSQTWI